MDNYVVAPGRAISTKKGIISAGEKITAKECGSFQELIRIGWIVKKEDVKFKNEVEEAKLHIAKTEPVEVVKPKKVKNKKEDKLSGVNFGAVKQDELPAVEIEDNIEENSDES